MNKYAFTKTARSRMYEEFDTLSPAAKRRLINSGVLRSGDQVYSGIERGNKNMIRRGVKVPGDPKTRIPIEVQALTLGEGLTMTPGVNQAYSTQPLKTYMGLGDYAQARLTLPDRSDPATAEALENQFRRITGSRNVNMSAFNSILKRHELYEAQDKANFGQGMNKVKGVTMAGPRATGVHNSLGVLGKEKQLLKGFSYLPEYEQMNRLRRGSGEDEVLKAGFGQAYSNPSNFTNKQVKALSNLAPTEALKSPHAPLPGSDAWDLGKAMKKNYRGKPFQLLKRILRPYS